MSSNISIKDTNPYSPIHISATHPNNISESIPNRNPDTNYIARKKPIRQLNHGEDSQSPTQPRNP